MASREKTIIDTTTNQEGFGSTADNTSYKWATPGVKTQTRAALVSEQRQTEDEGCVVKFRIPIKGIC